MLEELGEINRNKITEKLSGIFEPVLERECMCERCRRERSTRLNRTGKSREKDSVTSVSDFATSC